MYKYAVVISQCCNEPDESLFEYEIGNEHDNFLLEDVYNVVSPWFDKKELAEQWLNDKGVR